MRVLLDTHFVLWLVKEHKRISASERRLIDRSFLLVSPLTIWELRLKWNALDRRGERKGLLDPEAALRFIECNGIELAPLTGEQCACPLDPPLAHRDPFDEMLLVHAEQLGARLLTRDRLLVDHPQAITA